MSRHVDSGDCGSVHSFDVKVFNPTSPRVFRCEGEKCRAYEQRIREVEHDYSPHLHSVPQEGWEELPLWPINN